jgi:hypothetical protein
MWFGPSQMFPSDSLLMFSIFDGARFLNLRMSEISRAAASRGVEAV